MRKLSKEIKKIMYGKTEPRDLYANGLKIVCTGAYNESEGDMRKCWILPGRRKTFDFDEALEYYNFVKRDRLHIKGAIDIDRWNKAIKERRELC